MKAFLENTAVTLNLAFKDSAGNSFEASAAEYRLVDQDGEELIARAAIPDFSAGSSATLTIGAANNALPEGETRVAREVQLWLTNANGTIGQTESYIIESQDPLAIPSKSFQTYANAEATAYGIPNLTGWKAASKEDRIAALIEARNRLVRIRYRLIRDDLDLVEPEFAASHMDSIEFEDWVAFPEEFKWALRHAQVIQADRLLSTDVHAEIAKHREDGLMSMTVGESSHMFRPGKPLLLNICREAYAYLAKYVTWRKRIGR